MRTQESVKRVAPYTGRVPNFMIAGEQKAGTSYLYHNLRAHPEVFLSEIKEPLFFSTPRFDSRCIDDYLRQHFSAAENENWVGEASSTYFHVEAAARRIKEAFGDAMKFIICLRHPTEKAVSLYLHNYRRGRLRGDEGLMTLEETPFRIRAFADHSKACSRFLEMFGPDNVHFLLFEKLRSSSHAFIASAFAFLDLSPHRPALPQLINKGNDLKWDGETLTIDENETLPVPHVRPRFSREELQELHESLQEDVERTERVTGLNLSRWKALPHFCSVLLCSFHLVLAFLSDFGEALT